MTDSAPIQLPQQRMQRDDVSSHLRDATPRAIYAHVPFCRHKCHYCDFYSVVDRRDRQPAFVDRMEREVHATRELASLGEVRTIFVGGGTPTLLDPPLLGRTLQAIRSLADGTLEEFTVEANPETVSREVADTLVASGVHRVSMGCQSFHPEHLKTLERWHDPASVPVAVENLRRAGIERISLDLIFGIPGSTLEDWNRDLEIALSLAPSHLSCYGLIFEPGTPLTEKQRLGRIGAVEEELEAEMFEETRRTLARSGFEHYEISNWARPGETCRHNLAYWRNDDWIGIGPAAAGHLGGIRYRQVPKLDEWMSSPPPAPVVDLECTSPAVQRGDRWMMGLRLRAGLPRNEVRELLREDRPRRSVVDRHLEAGRLEWHQDRLRISEHALVLSDLVITDLVIPDDGPLSP